ncbi:hypothetical protein RB619_05025 [Flavobacterium sp. LHD-80]|uniref:hypothetical protein n=1 Tax=Flavobacterium sp. LHD-80 TaxID=3071411 RepID=UPI0027DF313A|nr:hypothetical protein [Flavobacterium sp. LHD-80]MDQ6469999.1 hypothetical protein [Flavobacterium sp. LHD-80]
MKKLIITSFLMCILGVTYANDCSKIVSDACWEIASSAVNDDEANGGGCFTDYQWHTFYCDYYNQCISH